MREYLSGSKVGSYSYTMHSSAHAETGADAFPAIKFSYDLSPMKVRAEHCGARARSALGAMNAHRRLAPRRPAAELTLRSAPLPCFAACALSPCLPFPSPVEQIQTQTHNKNTQTHKPTKPKPTAQVVERETRVPLYHFVTSVCAIIGGFFTLLTLLEGTVHYSIETVAKKLS